MENKIEKVQKRNGSIVPFDQSRIEEAIFKALTASGEGDRKRAKRPSNKVVQFLNRRFKKAEIPLVEQIQDIVVVLFFTIFVFIHINAATIYINIKNINGTAGSNAYVKLYNSEWALLRTGHTDTAGLVTFALLDYGTYNYEVYYTGNTLEFWGRGENINLSSPTLSVNFTRYCPYRYIYSTPGSSVLINEQLTYEITIKNPLSFSTNVKVEIWVDRDKSSPYDYHSLSSYQSISSNGTKTFTFNFTPTITGTYYWKMHVLSYNDEAGDYIITDSYFWTQAFTVTNSTSIPITSGRMVFHRYSSYDVWDSKLYEYNFFTHTLTEISSNWTDIDHPMNAHYSPDGSMITFMGVPKGCHTYSCWDIYLWDFSANHPINLTNCNGVPDEDPKFSPDGLHIVFKQNGDIKIMNLSGVIEKTVTNDGYTIEESMPYFTNDGKKIIFMCNEGALSSINLIDTNGTNNIVLVDEPSVQEMYPIIRDSMTFLYTRWLSPTDDHDDIYLGYLDGSPLSLLPFNLSTADDSVPFPNRY